MRKNSLWLVGLLLALCCGCASAPAPSPGPGEAMVRVADREVPLALPASLEARRPEFVQHLHRAQARLEAFARAHGWQHLAQESLIQRAEIYDSKEGFDARLRQLAHLPADQPIPKSFVAGPIDGVFFAVTPELQRQLNPEDTDPQAYEKLITHELLHLLHVRILQGDEDAMGPVWFYEGLATYGAAQYPEFHEPADAALRERTLAAQERGSYRDYTQVLRYYLQHTTLPELVARAGKPDFQDWLKTLR